MARAIAATHYVSPGIYVRDISDGKVRAVKGQSYMLRSNEELWEKDLPPAVEELIAREMEADERDGGGGGGGADQRRGSYHPQLDVGPVQIEELDVATTT